MDDTLKKLATTMVSNGNNSFEELSKCIVSTHNLIQSKALKAVNQMVTLRNWLIGYYIVEYEQNGSDRAKYGDKLLKRLEEKIKTKGLNLTLFKLSRNFYFLYPQFGSILNITQSNNNLSLISDDLEKGATSSHQFTTKAETLLTKLSFSHIREIMTQDDPLARYFYETECIKGTWSVKELRRQIATNLYFRSGVSKNPKKLLESIKPEIFTPELAIRQPLTLEFLGLDVKDTIDEKDLENALIKHLQDFILELGKGFCFEERHKRILIDDEYYFADLVFYNRFLHCNVIFELKNDSFKHEYLGQLNAYVSYYKENEMQKGDNPPIGILLCTKQGKKMVEYAIAGMDNKLFVSNYMLQLPDKTTLENFLLDEMKNKN